MNRILIRLSTAIAASCSLIIGGLAFPAAAATPAPVPPANVIIIPSPDQVTDTVDASRCPWLIAYVSMFFDGLTQASEADGYAVSQETALSNATLLTAPLAAAQCGPIGN